MRVDSGAPHAAAVGEDGQALGEACAQGARGQQGEGICHLHLSCNTLQLLSLIPCPAARIRQGGETPVPPGTNNTEGGYCFFPGYPLLRYASARAHSVGAQDNQEKVCGKYAQRHKALTPGVFIVFCGHGECLGYKLMAKFEGPSTAFDLMRTRLDTGW